MLIVKGKGSAEESVEHHAAGPDVHLGAGVQLPGYNLSERKTSKYVPVRWRTVGTVPYEITNFTVQESELIRND